jgi:hypothetical protein
VSSARKGLTLWFLVVASAPLAGSVQEAPARVVTGTLRLQSLPGVEVLWEGVLLGETDRSGSLVIGGIPPGSYTVTLRRADFVGQTLNVTVEAGSQELKLPLRKIREAPAAPPQDRVAEPVPPPRPPAPTPKTSASVESPARPPDADAALGASPAAEAIDRISSPRSEVASPQPLAPPEMPDAEEPVVEPIAGGRDSQSPLPDSLSAANGGPSRWVQGFLPWVAGLGLLLVAAGLALRQRTRSRDRSHRPRGPQVVLERPRRRRRTPAFFQDLKERESVLEDLAEERSGRARRKVIDVEVTDIRPAEDSE